MKVTNSQQILIFNYVHQIKPKIEKIKEIFIRIINQAEWMDLETKQYAIKKVQICSCYLNEFKIIAL